MQNTKTKPVASDVQYILYADGAAPGNGKKPEGVDCGWGARLEDRTTGEVTEAHDGFEKGTNNQAELTAVIKGVKLASEGSVVHVRTDSQYVCKGIEEWLPGWKRRGWTTAAGGPVANQALWKALDELRSKYKLSFQWVKGHAKDPGNERADALANLGVALVRERRAKAA